MKKTILSIIVLCTFSFATQAQTSSKVGIKGAYGSANATSGYETDGKTSYKIGVIGDYPISDMLSFQTGLYFSNRGYERFNNGFKNVTNANYFEIPLTFAYKIPLAKQIKLGINVGPYFAYGIGGKTKITGYEFEEKWKTFKGKTVNGVEYDTKRFDWGGTVGIAIELFVLEISANYDLGLRDIYSINDSYMRNSMFWLGAAIKF